MLDYLYYKLYQASLKSSLSDIPELMAPAFMGGLISVNMLVLNGLLLKLGLVKFMLFDEKQQAVGFVLVLIIIIMIYYRSRYEFVIKKYSNENKHKQKYGNIIIGFYIVISFFSIFLIAFL